MPDMCDITRIISTLYAIFYNLQLLCYLSMSVYLLYIILGYTVPTTIPFIVQTKTNNKSFNEFIAKFLHNITFFGCLERYVVAPMQKAQLSKFLCFIYCPSSFFFAFSFVIY